MTPTNEQIVVEANRRALECGWGAPPVEHYIIEVVREGWTPPPVDPEVLAVREVLARSEVGGENSCAAYLAGAFDSHRSFRMALAAYKAGRDAEAERAKVLVEPAQAIVNRAVRGTGANNVRWPHILKAARRLEKALADYKA